VSEKTGGPMAGRRFPVKALGARVRKV
jgi:hypothetical protein